MKTAMILSANGALRVVSAYVNLLTLAGMLHMSTETTMRFAQLPVVKALMLFSFAVSIIPDKLACVLATLFFFVFEVKNFVSDAASSIKTHDDD